MDQRQPDTPMPEARYVGASLPGLAQARPDQPALTCATRHLDWRALERRVRCLATAVHGRTGAGAAVALELADPLDLVVAFLAVGRAGGRALVYDSAWTEAQRQAIAGQARPRLTLDPTTLAELEAGALPERDAPTEPTPGQAFYVGFTSGSTGLPKGYRRAHASWLASFDISRRLFDLGPDDVVMAPGSLATSLHLYGVIHALQDGIPAVLVARFRPRTVLDQLRRSHVTALYGTPTQIQLLLQTAERDGAEPLPALRHLIVSGAKWPDGTRSSLRHWFPAARLTEFYGTSEMSFVALHHDDDPAPPGSVGRAVPGVGIRIGATPEAPRPAGETGRIWVRSPLLFEGYECGGGEEIAFHGDWLTVGDHGWLDEAGHLYLAGREKRMIVSSGINLYPEEMEAWLTRLDGVRQAAVLGQPDALRGQRIRALVQADPAVSDADLQRHCARRFPTGQCPRDWIRVSDWPLTPSGKTDFRRLATTWLDDPAEARS